MKKKISLFIVLFFLFFSIANAEELINYDWSFNKTNYNYGYGLNNILIANNNYFTWHLSKSTFNNVITEYNESGSVINTYEPDIDYPIVDLIYYDNTYIAIDRLGNIYKLDKTFNIIKSISNPERISIINDKSELKISKNTIYYIDKTTFNIYSSDYQLDNYEYYDLEQVNSIEEVFSLVPFLSETDKMYFSYLNTTLDNREEVIITDVLKNDSSYYITSATYSEDKITSSIKLVDETLNVKWEDNYSDIIPLNILIFKEYVFVLSINTNDQTYRVKVYNSNNQFINEEKIELRDKDAIPISFITNNQSILIKSILYKADDILTLDLVENYSEIVIDKYSINTFNIRKVVQGEGVIEAKDNAISGDFIRFKVVAKEGYVLDKLSIKDKEGNSILLSDFTFKMPSSDVTITAVFVPKNPNTEDNISFLVPIFIISLDILLISIYQYKRCKN